MKWDYKPLDSGLYPAVPGETEFEDMSSYSWIRDNAYIYYSGVDQKQIGEAFAEIVRKHEDKIRYHTEHPPDEEWMHIHPRYNEELEEVPGEWGWIQQDSVGNLLEILSEQQHFEEAELVYNYLENVGLVPDYGMWEEGPRKMRPCSHAAILRGLKAYPDSDPEFLQHVEQKMLESLEDYRPDLSLLTLLWPKRLVDRDTEKQIMKKVQPLIRENGVVRYHGDKWNGNGFIKGPIEGNEAQWTFGLAYLYLITKDSTFLTRLEELREQAEGVLPEAFVGGEPNPNTPLLWSEAMYQHCKEIEKSVQAV